MPRVTLMQTNFTAGEMSPRLLGRVDIARYSNGAKVIENAYPLVHGIGGYGVPEIDPPGAKAVFFDTMLPAFKTATVNGSGPGDLFIADVTP